MNSTILGRQIAAACALLGWSRAELAGRAGLGEAELESAEGAAVRDARNERIVTALKAGGIIFLDGHGEGPGVRLGRSFNDEGRRPEELDASNDD
jgi:hypothetical protein